MLKFFCQLKDEELNFYQNNPDSFYIVPFADALDLVQSRQVVIKSVSFHSASTVRLCVTYRPLRALCTYPSTMRK